MTRIKHLTIITLLIVGFLRTTTAQRNYATYLSNNNLAIAYIDMQKLATSGKFDYWRGMLPLKPSKDFDMKLLQSILGGDNSLGVDFRSIAVMGLDEKSAEIYIPLNDAKQFKKLIAKGEKIQTMKVREQKVYTVKSGPYEKTIIAWNEHVAVIFVKFEHSYMHKQILLEHLFMDKGDYSILSEPHFARFWKQRKDLGMIYSPQLLQRMLSDENSFVNDILTKFYTDEMSSSFLNYDYYTTITLAFENGHLELKCQFDGDAEAMEKLNQRSASKTTFHPQLLLDFPTDASIYMTLNTDTSDRHWLKMFCEKELWWVPCVLMDDVNHLAVAYKGGLRSLIPSKYSPWSGNNYDSAEDKEDQEYFVATFSVSDEHTVLQALRSKVMDINREQAEEEERWRNYDNDCNAVDVEDYDIYGNDYGKPSPRRDLFNRNLDIADTISYTTEVIDNTEKTVLIYRDRQGAEVKLEMSKTILKPADSVEETYPDNYIYDVATPDNGEETYYSYHYQYAIGEEMIDGVVIHTMRKIKFFSRPDKDTIVTYYIVFWDGMGMITTSRKQVQRFLSPSSATSSTVLNKLQSNSSKLFYAQTGDIGLKEIKEVFSQFEGVVVSAENSQVSLRLDLSDKTENSLYQLIKLLWEKKGIGK